MPLLYEKTSCAIRPWVKHTVRRPSRAPRKLALQSQQPLSQLLQSFFQLVLWKALSDDFSSNSDLRLPLLCCYPCLCPSHLIPCFRRCGATLMLMGRAAKGRLLGCFANSKRRWPHLNRFMLTYYDGVCGIEPRPCSSHWLRFLAPSRCFVSLVPNLYLLQIIMKSIFDFIRQKVHRLHSPSKSRTSLSRP